MGSIVYFILMAAVSCGFARQVNHVRNSTSSHQDSESNDSGTKTSICHYNDPNVEDCIKSLTEKARHFLSSGAPDLGIQPMEPLKVPNIRLRQHSMPRNAFKYDAWLSDVVVKGLGNFSINKLDVYPEELKVKSNVSLPHLMLTGDYVMLGEFQMLPVESTGKINANFSECTASLEAVGARVHKRMVVRDANVRLRCTGPLLADLDDAHSTTADMEHITEHIARIHSSDLSREIQPAVETALAMVLEDVANKFLKHIPADMVFPN